jgi:hypothetical protein
MTSALLQRVVWNTADWRKPTATSDEGDYVGEHGFGHEEWNFQTDDAVDGHVLGYLYYRPGAATLKKAGGRFDIGFWTLHPKSRGRFLVGRWREASLASDSFIKKADRQFTNVGVYQRRAEELRAVRPSLSAKAAYEAARQGIRDGWVRFICPVEAVEVYGKTGFVKLPASIDGYGLSLRFASPTFVTAVPGKLKPAAGKTASGGYGDTSPLVETILEKRSASSWARSAQSKGIPLNYESFREDRNAAEFGNRFHLGLERQLEMVLEHRNPARDLFGLVVRVDRCLDHLGERRITHPAPRLANLRLLRRLAHRHHGTHSAKSSSRSVADSWSSVRSTSSSYSTMGSSFGSAYPSGASPRA